jgi:hypothetical protein
MTIKRFFKLNSYEIVPVIFKLNFKFKYEKFRVFCNILYEFTYPEQEPDQKTSAPAPAICCRTAGSGSPTLCKSVSAQNQLQKVVQTVNFFFHQL